MAQHNEVGQWGEQTAALHLMHQDYQILERNWRFRHLEIDIIAEYLGEIVFVEVKTRTGGDFLEARAAVDFYKRKHIMDAAQAYLRQNRLDNTWRYDVITIIGDAARYRLRHEQRAFDWRTQMRLRG